MQQNVDFHEIAVFVVLFVSVDIVADVVVLVLVVAVDIVFAVVVVVVLVGAVVFVVVVVYDSFNHIFLKQSFFKRANPGLFPILFFSFTSTIKRIRS